MRWQFIRKYDIPLEDQNIVAQRAQYDDFLAAAGKLTGIALTGLQYTDFTVGRSAVRCAPQPKAMFSVRPRT